MRFDAVSYRLRGLVSLGGYVQAFGLACHRYEAVAWYGPWVPDSRGRFVLWYLGRITITSHSIFNP